MFNAFKMGCSSALSFVLLACFFPLSSSFAQVNPPLKEFRGVWVATINNIDWPSKRGLTAEEQKKEFIELLDFHQSNGINALFFQIRPASDAFYQSTLEPWSQWLTGEQGVSPGYDPLAFMLEETHKRYMEFHAWINPFRAVANKYSSSIHKNHISNRKPQWLMEYGELKLFNPGIPEARDYIISVIQDIVARYDIDGVHFDDYFYPYPIEGEKIDDLHAFYKYRSKGQRLNDWRRENINKFIFGVHKAITETKPWVKFGVSPFGIWRNKFQSDEGSETFGLSCYDDVFADVRLWIQNGWVDYMAPQLYQSIDSKVSNYVNLTKWWSENAYGRHVYIGHAIYKINFSKGKGWNSNSQIPRQIRLRRATHDVAGSILYSTRSLRQNRGSIVDSLRLSLFNNVSLIPAMPWKDLNGPPAPVQNLVAAEQKDGVKLSWELPDSTDARFAAIYRASNLSKEDSSASTERLLAVVHVNNTQEYFDSSTNNANLYEYSVTLLDRLNVESERSYPEKIFHLEQEPFWEVSDQIAVFLSGTLIHNTRNTLVQPQVNDNELEPSNESSTISTKGR